MDRGKDKNERPNRRREMTALGVAAAIIVVLLAGYLMFDGGFRTAPDMVKQTYEAVDEEQMAPE